MRFRLRYMNHDLELNEGEFVVGRNASCQLSLDDPLVSRRHATFIVHADAVTVEDLGSRNGVSVNGERIGGRTLLRPGDRVQIGSQEMVLVAGQSEAVRTATRNPLKMTLPNVATQPPNMPALTTKPPMNPSDPDAEASMVRRADAFNLLGSVAEKALAMGKHAEAERILASPLADVIEASRAGKRITPSLLDQAARFSARLATATGKGAWADYVVELYQSQGRLVPAPPVIDELYNAFRRVSAIDLGRLRDYVAQLRDQMAQFGPAERFLFQRIEGLERLAAIR